MECLDPDGRLAAHVDVNRVLGCVVFPAGRIVSPGVVQHTEGNRFPLGELDGSDSLRARALVEMFTNAGGTSVELARLTGIATPGIDGIYALAKLMDKTMREDQGAVQLRRMA